MNTGLISYLVIGVVAIYFFIAKVLPFLKKVKKVSKGLFSKIYLNKDANLSTEQYKKISLGAIYSEQQTTFINSLATGTGKSDLKTILEKWWGIASREDAMETLGYLEKKGFRFYLPIVLKAYKAPEAEQEAVILSLLHDEEDI